MPSCCSPAALRCRRDLDAARLLADQVRKREKLKKQELKLFQEEWAARLAGGCSSDLCPNAPESSMSGFCKSCWVHRCML